MFGEKIVTISPNVARILHDCFQEMRSRTRVLQEAPRAPFEMPDASVLTREINIENVERPPVMPPRTEAQHAERIAAGKAMRRFRTMSVFCGAGGMDIGMAQTDAFRTECAIDTCPNSAATFASHHPDVQFLCMDAGLALQHRVALGMPKSGEVDVMLLGPPCQSFSSLNQHSSEDTSDSRSLLVATALSYVDILRPFYGFIENVCGMMFKGTCGVVKRKGMIRFISATLEAMGYNVRFCKVQCGYYGVPQSRSRVKIIFALRSVTLPAAPVPTTKLAGHDPRKGGPGAAVTIADATSDLPRWEYRNPNHVYSPPRTLRDSRSPALRPPQPEPDVANRKVGLESCTYATAPANDFQRSMRPGGYAHPNAIVQQHVTSIRSDTHVERIFNIPFDAGSNHMDLYRYGHGRLGVAMTKELKLEAAYKHAYERLDANDAFQIVITGLVLEGKLGRLLMPSQERVPSVRELARAQGFPDAIIFRGGTAASIRQIGNAVPVGLAKAIGLSIRESAIDDFLAGDQSFCR